MSDSSDSAGPAPATGRSAGPPSDPASEPNPTGIPSENQPPRPANRLAHSTSAYLRQHQWNPVDWHPWGPEALERARREDKPLLVSIGYSACHWCHVMAHESFEDEATAAVMNELFINIKVDREERPDVDQIYMDTVTALTGHGGWPLTVFCAPDGEPFYAGTYYPKEPRHGLPSFQQVLHGVDHAYREQRSEVDATCAKILEALGRRPEGAATAPPGAGTAATAALKLLQRADAEHGGFGGAPKFPTPPSLDLLLAAADVLPARKAREALEHVELSCRRMVAGGLYDQLGGGFHRYSVDDHWGVPHFEKMLYDQGQLLRTCAESARRAEAPSEAALWPLRETVAYLRRELRGPEGGFYASQDADSEGEEGTFYVWTPEQIEAVLGREGADRFCTAYGVTGRGNFENATSVLFDAAAGDRASLAGERGALFEARAKRIAPATDEKRIAAWNGLAISGLARASSVAEDPSMLDDAVTTADFVLGQMIDGDGRLLRVWNEGRAHVTGFLDDHAAMLEALLDLYRAGAGARFLPAAIAMADAIATRFFDADEGDFFLTPSDGERLAHRPRSDHDGATPHSCGLATLGLLRVASLSGRRDLAALASRVIETHAYELEAAPEAFPTLARAALLAERGAMVVVVAGGDGEADTRALLARARLVTGPEDAVIAHVPGSPAPDGIDPDWLNGRDGVDGRAAAYVCRGTTCSLPVTDPATLTGAEPSA